VPDVRTVKCYSLKVSDQASMDHYKPQIFSRTNAQRFTIRTTFETLDIFDWLVDTYKRYLRKFI